MPGPVVQNWSPDPSVQIETDTPVAFQVVDVTTALRVVAVMVKPGNGSPWECAYDGAGFGPNYSTLSTVSGIANGLQFRLRRDQGWQSVPTFKVIAVDTAGNMAP